MSNNSDTVALNLPLAPFFKSPEVYSNTPTSGHIRLFFDGTSVTAKIGDTSVTLTALKGILGLYEPKPLLLTTRELPDGAFPSYILFEDAQMPSEVGTSVKPVAYTLWANAQGNRTAWRKVTGKNGEIWLNKDGSELPYSFRDSDAGYSLPFEIYDDNVVFQADQEGQPTMDFIVYEEHLKTMMTQQKTFAKEERTSCKLIDDPAVSEDAQEAKLPPFDLYDRYSYVPTHPLNDVTVPLTLPSSIELKGGKTLACFGVCSGTIGHLHRSDLNAYVLLHDSNDLPKDPGSTWEPYNYTTMTSEGNIENWVRRDGDDGQIRCNEPGSGSQFTLTFARGDNQYQLPFDCLEGQEAYTWGEAREDLSEIVVIAKDNVKILSVIH